MPLVITLAAAQAAQTSDGWVTIGYLGQFADPGRYGTFELTADMVGRWQKNLAAGVVTGEPNMVAIDYEHAMDDPRASPSDKRASGWIRGIRLTGQKIQALIEWTQGARQAIESGEFRYFSPTFGEHFKNDQGEDLGDTLVGGALTNRPFLRSKGALCVQLSQAGDVLTVVDPPDAVRDPDGERWHGLFLSALLDSQLGTPMLSTGTQCPKCGSPMTGGTCTKCGYTATGQRQEGTPAQTEAGATTGLSAELMLGWREALHPRGKGDRGGEFVGKGDGGASHAEKREHRHAVEKQVEADYQRRKGSDEDRRGKGAKDSGDRRRKDDSHHASQGPLYHLSPEQLHALRRALAHEPATLSQQISALGLLGLS